MALCLVIGLGAAATAGTADPNQPGVPDALSTRAAPDAGAPLSYEASSGSTVAPAAVVRPSDQSRAPDQAGQRDLLILLLMRNLSARGPFGTFGR